MYEGVMLPSVLKDSSSPPPFLNSLENSEGQSTNSTPASFTTTSITLSNTPAIHEESNVRNSSVTYCDTCKTACVFMNGRRRKLQVRYEGYVLVKRGPSANSYIRSSLPYVSEHRVMPPSINITPAASAHERRHSYSDLIDDPKLKHEPGCAGHLSTAPPCNKIPLASPAPLKLVNLITDGGSADSCHGYNGVNFHNNINNNSINPDGYLIGNPHKPLMLARRDKKSRAHQRLCRKKSRSQENLSSRRRISSANDNAGIVLNNTIQPQPLAVSPLSRSEGSIHNVHKIISSGSSSHEGGDGTLCGGVADLAKVKKLLSRVTDEVGQIVFDWEGWTEQYLTLTDSAIEIRNVSIFVCL